MIKIINSIISIIQKTYHKIQIKPRTIGIHTTQECNLSCDYCYSKKTINSKIDWFKILKESKKLGVKHILFLGGEPFCDKNIFKYLDFCSKNNIQSSIYTNAFLINNDIYNKLKKYKNTDLIIKFDVKNNIEEISGINSYDKLIGIIKYISDIKKSLHVFISKKNFKNISEIIKDIKRLNIPVSFERYMPSNSDIDKDYEIDSDKYNFALNQISKYRKDIKNIMISILKGCSCSCYVDAMFISSNGNVKPCPMSSEKQSIGNIKDNSLISIWNKYVKLRKKWMIIPDDCKNCKNKYICHGGCKTYTFNKYNNYNKKDPLCLNNEIPTKFVFEKKLR